MQLRKFIPRNYIASMPVHKKKFYCKMFIFIIFIITAITLITGLKIHLNYKSKVHLNGLYLDITTGDFDLDGLTGVMGNQDGGWWSKPWSGCTVGEHIHSRDILTVACPGRADLSITSASRCFQVLWISHSPGFIPMDCFSTEGHHWYGGAELLSDLWTIEKSHMPMKHFISSHVGLVRGSYGGVMERYWLTSNGFTLTVDDSTPLHVGIEEKRICFKADYANSWYQNPKKALPVLNYTICSSDNVFDAHLLAVKLLFKPSQVTPHPSLFTKPIWSTWAKYKRKVTQSKVLEYASLIKEKGFDGCQIEIDDGYTKHYGDSVFDPEKFPDPVAMSNRLKSLGFNVTAWIVPYTNKDSSNYAEGMKKGYFVKSDIEKHLVKWPRGKGAVLDLTNPEAVAWMGKRLKTLQSQGIDAFKFDAGESNFIPREYRFFKPLVNLNHYGGLYASLMHELIGNRMNEVRVGYKTQHLPMMVRMMDKDSTWGYHRGLQTLIPSALLFGILGYPYVLPDMVGGNGYGGEVKTLPDKELYLRWLAATVLLPFVQISIPPWDYDAEAVSMAKDLLNIREQFLKDIQKAAQISAATAYPIIRPLWWIDPNNKETFSIDSEFILGDDLLVAPVLQKGHNKRDIYLPRGMWKDMRTGELYTGQRTVYDYQVALNELPVFRLISSRRGDDF